MHFEVDNLYHVYNRGNNKQTIFFTEANYSYFLKKVSKYVVPNCDLLSYCLMPNHFHFLIHANERTVSPVNHNGMLTRTMLSDGIRLLLSAYAKGINVQESMVGNLFQQKTKARLVTEDPFIISPAQKTVTYAEACFHYIHQNPLKAGLVTKLEDWKHSSFRDYAGLTTESICNKKLAKALFDVSKENLFERSLRMIPDFLDNDQWKDRAGRMKIA